MMQHVHNDIKGVTLNPQLGELFDIPFLELHIGCSVSKRLCVVFNMLCCHANL